MSGEKSKTDTIKQRRVDVYLPSLEMKERWSEIADERGQSVSKFVIETVEDVLNRKDEDYETRQELLEENRELKEKVKELKKDVNAYRKGYEKLEEELKDYRTQEFKRKEVYREYPEKLVRLLKKNGFIRFKDIYDKLNVRETDDEKIAEIQNHLKVLEDYGFVKEESKGWRWKGE